MESDELFAGARAYLPLDKGRSRDFGRASPAARRDELMACRVRSVRISEDFPGGGSEPGPLRVLAACTRLFAFCDHHSLNNS